MRKIGNIIASFIGNINSVEKTTSKDLNVKGSNSFKECLNTKNKNIKNESSKEKDYAMNSSSIDDTAQIKENEGKSSIEDTLSKVENEKNDSKEYDVIEELLFLLINGETNNNYDYEKVISENEFLSEEVKTMILDLMSIYNSTESNTDNTVIEGKKESAIADIMEFLKNDSSVDKEMLNSILESVKKSSSEVESPKEIINYIKTSVIKETNTDNNELIGNKTNLINSIDENDESIDLSTKNSDSGSESKNHEDSSEEDTFLTSLIEGNDKGKNEGNLIQVPKMAFEPLKDVKECAPALTNKANMVEDIIKSVKYMNDESVKEIVLKVVPRSLGEVVISLSMDKGIMKANVTTNNAETYNLLATKIEEMNKILNEFKVESFDLTYMNNSEYGENNKEGNDKNNFQRNSKSSFISVEDDVTEETNDETYSNIDMLA